MDIVGLVKDISNKGQNCSCNAVWGLVDGINPLTVRMPGDTVSIEIRYKLSSYTEPEIGDNVKIEAIGGVLVAIGKIEIS